MWSSEHDAVHLDAELRTRCGGSQRTCSRPDSPAAPAPTARSRQSQHACQDTPRHARDRANTLAKGRLGMSQMPMTIHTGT
eukprot:1355992-Rhodomonas_salina.1